MISIDTAFERILEAIVPSLIDRGFSEINEKKLLIHLEVAIKHLEIVKNLFGYLGMGQMDGLCLNQFPLHL